MGLLMKRKCRKDGHRWGYWIRPSQPFGLIIHEYRICERCNVRQDRNRV